MANKSPFTYSRSDLTTLTPGNVTEAAEIVREASAAHRAILARGGGTKWSAGQQPIGDAVILSTMALTGILEYDPGELTITALAGTQLTEIETALAKNGQYLPFDPPFASHGATLGGTVAAGLAGPRRIRYGGVRDFVIGIRYLNAAGELVHSGGKVVKNAAGYDFSKLFCGSLGTLGVLVEVSFKVFPQPQASQTLVVGLNRVQDVQALLLAVQHSPIEISAADVWTNNVPMQPSAGSYTAAVQVAGALPSLAPRIEAIRDLLPAYSATRVLDDASQESLWAALRDVQWIGESGAVLRLYLPPNKLAALDAALADQRAERVYSVGGNVAWAALPGDPRRLSPVLEKLGVQAAIWRADDDSSDILPALPGAALVKRVKRAFDPQNIFYPGRYAAG